jgi:hypothetical protein
LRQKYFETAMEATGITQKSINNHKKLEYFHELFIVKSSSKQVEAVVKGGVSRKIML